LAESGSIGRSFWQQGKFVVLLQHFLNSPGGNRTKYKEFQNKVFSKDKNVSTGHAVPPETSDS